MQSSIIFHNSYDVSEENSPYPSFLPLENEVYFTNSDFEFLSETEPEKTSPLLKTSKKISKSASSESSNNSKSPKARASRNMWKPHEDELLLELYAKYGPKWTYIGNTIGGRTCKQVRDRYLNHIRPDISYAPFTPQEDQQLHVLHAQFGHKWKQIAEKMPGRSPAQVKNRFYLYLNPHKKMKNAFLSHSLVGKNIGFSQDPGQNQREVYFSGEDYGFGFISYEQEEQVNEAETRSFFSF